MKVAAVNRNDCTTYAEGKGRGNEKVTNTECNRECDWKCNNAQEQEKKEGCEQNNEKEKSQYCQFYHKLNKNKNNWIKEIINRNRNFSFQKECKSFATLYEERKEHVTQKYNLRRYIDFFINLIILAFVILDLMGRACTGTLQMIKGFFVRISSYFSYFKNFPLKEEINKRKQKTWNQYRTLFICKAQHFWEDRENFITCGKYYMHNMLQIFYARILQIVQHILHFFYLKYPNFFKNKKLFSAFSL